MRHERIICQRESASKTTARFTCPACGRATTADKMEMRGMEMACNGETLRANHAGAAPGAIRVHFPERKSASGPVPDFTISFNDLSMTVDTARLPARLYRLLPKVLGTARPDEWRPFCVMAVAMGLMR